MVSSVKRLRWHKMAIICYKQKKWRFICKNWSKSNHSECINSHDIVSYDDIDKSTYEYDGI